MAAASETRGDARTRCSGVTRPTCAPKLGRSASRLIATLDRAGLGDAGAGSLELTSNRAQDDGPTPVTPVDAEPSTVTDRLAGPRVPVRRRSARAVARLLRRGVDRPTRSSEAGRDWWPIAIRWATRGAVPSRPGAVARPRTAEEVAAVLACCNEARVPVTASGGRSGVCGSSVPVFGGVALDMTGVEGVVDIDTTLCVADVRAGTFGPELERSLREPRA